MSWQTFMKCERESGLIPEETEGHDRCLDEVSIPHGLILSDTFLIEILETHLGGQSLVSAA